jgi:hexokinase
MFKQFYCFLFIFLLAHHSKCAKKLSPDFQNNVDDLSKQFAFNVDDLIKLDQSFEKVRKSKLKTKSKKIMNIT